MTNYPNWFSHQDYVFAKHLAPLANAKNINVLQIGTFTGDASVWLLKNILTDQTSLLTDVDTWLGSDEPAHKGMDFEDVYLTYFSKVSKFSNVNSFKGTSDEFFAENEETFDFIYIDGDHTSQQVLKDAENALKILRPNGILAFDDYGWGRQFAPELTPKPAIDEFLYIHKEEFEVLEFEYQVWVRLL
jgi:predicted O-methyltransferase YrrM